MPIIFDEVSAEVAPRRPGGDDDARSGDDAGAQPGDLEGRIEAALAHRRRRAERLSDR